MNFARLGYYNEPINNGIIDAGLTGAIWEFQKHKNLKNDGWMRPAGETEQALSTEINQLRTHILKKKDEAVDYKKKLSEYDFPYKGDKQIDILKKTSF